MTEFYALLYNTHTAHQPLLSTICIMLARFLSQLKIFFLKEYHRIFFPRTSRKHKKILIFLDMKLGLIKGKITKPYS